MKKLRVLFLIGLVFILSGCNNKYLGYYCHYEETSTIVVLLERDIDEKDLEKIEEKINSFDNIEMLNYYSVEDYAKELGGNAADLDIYATFVVLFHSMDNIGTYIQELSEMNGVKSATQSNAKSNVSLYNLKKNKTYTFADSDEATENDLVKGKYKIKKGAIVFTPEDKDKDASMLYIKDGHLCGDVECNTIYFESDGTCK